MIKKGILIAITTLLLFSYGGNLHGQETGEQKAERMKWFKEARLGIFVHWGIYAVNGIDESWSFFNGYISYDDYMKQLDGFTASNYDPSLWASLIKESGARYAVLTTKHHDGVALWNTKMNDLNVIKKTPAGRDLVTPFVKALRDEQLKIGLYFSILDWSHPDYPNFTNEKKKYTDNDPERYQRFTDFNHGQIKELGLEFNPDIYWFDGGWEQSAEWWQSLKIKDMIHGRNNKAIINSRIQAYGDYANPEQGLPAMRPGDEYWELCLTMNDSWGYQPNDNNYKTPGQLIRIFAECISMGGNMLLNISPKADGSIPDVQARALKELGRWTGKHSEAIYGTEAGLPSGLHHGPSTISTDSTSLYLFISGKPADSQVMLKGVKNKINRIYVVGDGTKLEHNEYLRPYWSDHAGVIFIDVPDEVLDEQMTVLCLMLDGKLSLSH